MNYKKAINKLSPMNNVKIDSSLVILNESESTDEKIVEDKDNDGHTIFTLDDYYIANRDDSLRVNLYEEIQLFCEEYLKDTMLLNIPPLQKCRYGNISFTNKIWVLFEEYFIIKTSVIRVEPENDDNDDDDFDLIDNV